MAISFTFPQPLEIFTIMGTFLKMVFYSICLHQLIKAAILPKDITFFLDIDVKEEKMKKSSVGFFFIKSQTLSSHETAPDVNLHVCKS